MDNKSQSKNVTTYGPYSPIKRAGSFYYVSGQVGIDPITKKAKIGIAKQTKQVLINLENVLKTQNLSLDNVVKTTVYLTNMADFITMNEVYTQFFDKAKPARATVSVKELPRLGKDVSIVIEIDAIAYKGDNDE